MAGLSPLVEIPVRLMSDDTRRGLVEFDALA
jgi:hypothetical protein